MRFKIESLFMLFSNIIIVLLGLATWLILMMTTNSVLITTVVTTILTVICIPISRAVNNILDNYLSEYWIEAHRQGKEKEREEVVKVIGWRLQHSIFETEVDVYDINGEKDTITVSELIRKELDNNPTTKEY